MIDIIFFVKLIPPHPIWPKLPPGIIIEKKPSFSGQLPLIKRNVKYCLNIFICKIWPQWLPIHTAGDHSLKKYKCVLPKGAFIQFFFENTKTFYTFFLIIPWRNVTLLVILDNEFCQFWLKLAEKVWKRNRKCRTFTDRRIKDKMWLQKLT